MLRIRRTSPVRASLAAALLLGLVALSAPADAEEIACPTDFEAEVVTHLNAERVAAGLGKLRMDVRLVAAAQRHVDDMAENHFASHTGSDGSKPADRILDAGYPSPGGEVVAGGQKTPAKVVQAWMNSDPHRKVILNPNQRHVGVGHTAADWIYDPLWTADFGRSGESPWTPEIYCQNGGSGAGQAAPVCDDGIDNDGDGLVDFGGDLGCQGPDDPSEETDCGDGVDNDGDGRVDFPDDPECRTATQFSESDPNCGLGTELVLLLPALAALRRRLVGVESEAS